MENEMSTQQEPAQLMHQTNYPQTPVGQPVILAPGQQLMYPGQQGAPVVGQPVYVQGTPGKQPPQYQMPPGGQFTQAQAGGVQQQPQFNLTMNFDYFKTPPAILKCVEFLVLLLAFATALKFQEIYSVKSRGAPIFTDKKLEFFLGATISGWVMCILIVFAFLFGLNRSCGVATNPIVLVALFHMAWVIMLGGGSGALAYRANQIVDVFHANGYTLSELPDSTRTQINCLFAAVFFGFLSFVIFVVDAALHYRMYTAMVNPYQGAGAVLFQQLPVQQYPGDQQVAAPYHPGTQQTMMPSQQES